MTTVLRPLAKFSRIFLCAAATNGQVVSTTRIRRLFAASSTAGATPWALITATAHSGTSSMAPTKRMPFADSSRMTASLCTISCRQYTGGGFPSSAWSAILMALSTPPQKPCGLITSMRKPSPPTARCGYASLRHPKDRLSPHVRRRPFPSALSGVENAYIQARCDPHRTR